MKEPRRAGCGRHRRAFRLAAMLFKLNYSRKYWPSLCSEASCHSSGSRRTQGREILAWNLVAGSVFFQREEYLLHLYGLLSSYLRVYVASEDAADRIMRKQVESRCLNIVAYLKGVYT